MPITCWCGRSSASGVRSRSTSSASQCLITDARPPNGHWSRAISTRRTRAALARLSAWGRTSHSGSKAIAHGPGTCSVLETARTAPSPGPKGLPSQGRGRRGREDRRHHPLLAWLARAGTAADHRFSHLLQRSALTIKGLTYMPTGATVAALTTSLPETPGGERNWDYRYTWMRDTTFTLRALHWMNLDWEADEFMHSSPTSSRLKTTRCRSCTGSTAGATSPSRREMISQDTREHDRCGSATAPSTSAKTTSTAPCSIRSCSTRAAASGCRTGSGPSSSHRRSAPPRLGASPTRASGKRAAHRSTMCPQS